MAFDMFEATIMLGDQVVELLPEVDILDLFQSTRGLSLPSTSFPAMNPLGNAVFDIAAIGYYMDSGPAFKFFEALDNSLKLHSVVGGFPLGSRAFCFFPGRDMAQDKCPATWTGVTAAGSVGEEDDLRSSGFGVWGSGSGRRFTVALVGGVELEVWLFHGWVGYTLGGVSS